MKRWIRTGWGRRSVVGLAAVAIGTAVLLPMSAPPSQAGFVLTPDQGIVVVTYGRTSKTAVELTWASRGSVSVTRTSKGNYTILAPSVTGTGNSQLVVLGPGAPVPLCSVTSTSNANPGTKIKVRCWSAVTGSVADAGFSLMFNSIRPAHHQQVVVDPYPDQPVQRGR